MKKIISLLVLLCSINSFSQSSVKEDNNIYALNGIDVKPEFQGGMDTFNSLVNESYLKSGFKSEKKQKVYLIGIIEKDGSLGDLKMLRGADSIDANELIAIVKSLPKWSPGKQNGAIVRVHYVFPLEIGN